MDYENLYRQTIPKQSLSGGYNRTNQLKDRSKVLADVQNQRYETILKNRQQEAINRQQAEQQRYQSQLNRKMQAAFRPHPRETVRVKADGTTTWSGGAGAVDPNKKYTEAEVYQGMAANNGGKAAVGQGNAAYGGQKGTPNYDWAHADYQSVLNNPNATEAQKAEARTQREQKLAYMQNNDFQQLINDEMAKKNPNLTTVAFWNQMRSQKLALQGENEKNYNDSDYTQDFQSLYNDAVKRGDTVTANQILQDRQKKIDFLSGNDMRALANQARAEGSETMADYYEALHQQKLQNPEWYGLTTDDLPYNETAGISDVGANSVRPQTDGSIPQDANIPAVGADTIRPQTQDADTLQIEGYNTSDYTQDFQALADAETDPDKKQKLLYARDNKIRFLAANDLKALADEARNSGDTVREDYYNQLHAQKMNLFANTDFNERIAQAQQAGDVSMEQAYTELRDQKIVTLLTSDFAALLGDAVQRGDQGEIQLYQNLRNQKLSLFANSDFAALAQAAQESGDMEMAQIYEALHNQKEEFLRNSDLQALINEAEQAGDKELAETYRRLREQKIENGFGTGNTGNGQNNSENGGSGLAGMSDNPYENFRNIYEAIAENNSNVGKEFDKISDYLGKMSGAYEDMAESQYRYNEYKAQADADKNITAMYQKFYQEDLPAFKERIANYGLSAAGGLSRQENLMMQSALMAERNELETAKNETIMQARMEADKLIAEGRMKEAEQLMNIGMERAKAIAQEQQNNMNLAMQLAQLISDKQEKEKDREHDLTMQERKEKQEEFITRLKHIFEMELSDLDFLEAVNLLVKEYGLKGIFDDRQTKNKIDARNAESKNIQTETEKQGEVNEKYRK